MFLNNLIKYFSIFCLIIIIFLTPRVVSAQLDEQELSRLDGSVISHDKEPIEGAEVQLQHKESGKIFQAKSNKKGTFISKFLPPGNYIFNIKKKGYKSSSGDLELPPNTTMKVVFTLVKEEMPEEKMKREAFLSFEKGIELVQGEKVEEAVQAFQKAVELKPDFAEAYLNLGILLFQQQKDDEAERALLKALELKPEESKSKEVLALINYEKARSLVQADKIDEALEKLKIAHSYNANHSFVNYLLGYVYYKKDMKDEAIKHLETFLQLEPNSPLAENAKELLEILKQQKE